MADFNALSNFEQIDGAIATLLLRIDNRRRTEILISERMRSEKDIVLLSKIRISKPNGCGHEKKELSIVNNNDSGLAGLILSLITHWINYGVKSYGQLKTKNVTSRIVLMNH